MTAKARRTGPLVVAGPRQRVVPPFTRNRIGSVERPTADDHAAADTGAEYRPEYDVCAATCAIGSLGQCKAIGIVGDPDGAADHAFEIARNGLSVHAHRIGAPQQSGCARNGSRRADPYASPGA